MRCRWQDAAVGCSFSDDEWRCELHWTLSSLSALSPPCWRQRYGVESNITSSSTIAERPRCTVGQFWPKVKQFLSVRHLNECNTLTNNNISNNNNTRIYFNQSLSSSELSRARVGRTRTGHCCVCDRDSLAFASEPVIASLANILRLDIVDQRTCNTKVSLSLTSSCGYLLCGLLCIGGPHYGSVRRLSCLAF